MAVHSNPASPGAPRVLRVFSLVLPCAALVVTASAQSASSVAVAEQGLASWYGEWLDGQLSASGEVYNQEQLTAAHRTLPFGTQVRVRRVDSPESIVVRINDRGPYVQSRIIDLSAAAARRLGMAHPGVVPVTVEVVNAPAADAPGRGAPAIGPQAVFAVQAATYRNLENAQRTRDRLERLYGPARLVARGRFWCVLVGTASTQEEAGSLAAAIRAHDKALGSAFVLRLDLSSPVTVE
jgi:rare lipoprotein A